MACDFTPMANPKWRKMQLNLSLFPYIASLLSLYEKAGQQPDNLCGPYWISLLLQSHGMHSVSAVDVALSASTVLPSQGNPMDWLPPQASSRLGPGYECIPTIPDIEACGTSVTGLIHATEQLSQGQFCLIPLQSMSWMDGLLAIWELANIYPDWQIIPILNAHTSYFWGSTPPLLSLLTYLDGRPTSMPAADWSVGHFALLIGQCQGRVQSLYTLLDTYPQFGWNGIHLQSPKAIAQSLQRPNQTTQGGIALFVATQWRSHLIPLAENAGLQIIPWNNGTSS